MPFLLLLGITFLRLLILVLRVVLAAWRTLALVAGFDDFVLPQRELKSAAVSDKGITGSLCQVRGSGSLTSCFHLPIEPACRLIHPGWGHQVGSSTRNSTENSRAIDLFGKRGEGCLSSPYRLRRWSAVGTQFWAAKQSASRYRGVANVAGVVVRQERGGSYARAGNGSRRSGGQIGY